MTNCTFFSLGHYFYWKEKYSNLECHFEELVVLFQNIFHNGKWVTSYIPMNLPKQAWCLDTGSSWEMKSVLRPQLTQESLYMRHLNYGSDDSWQCQELDHANVKYPGFDWKMSALHLHQIFFFSTDNLRGSKGLNHFTFCFILSAWSDTTSLHIVAMLFLRHLSKSL